MLSPVRADSSTALSPSRTTPSAGIFSPGLTAKISPFRTDAIGTSSSPPSSRITRAVFGASFMRERRASVVFPFERASRVLPTVMRQRIMAADSKLSPCRISRCASGSPDLPIMTKSMTEE